MFINNLQSKKIYKPDAEEKNFKRWSYMQSLTLEPEEYQMLKRAFCGGFTHASPFYSGEICDNVMSMDSTSSNFFDITEDEE